MRQAACGARNLVKVTAQRDPAAHVKTTARQLSPQLSSAIDTREVRIVGTAVPAMQAGCYLPPWALATISCAMLFGTSS